MNITGNLCRKCLKNDLPTGYPGGSKKKSLVLSCVCILFLILFFAAILAAVPSCSGPKDIASATPQDTSEFPGTGLFPDYNGFVNDYTGTIPNEILFKTEQLVQEAEDLTGCEIAVAVVRDLGGFTVEDYASGLFGKWGVGKEDEDNGVLLLVSMYDRELRIEVGYGLEAVITDIEAKYIIDDIIIPYFKNNDYGNGIYNGTAAIANKLYEEKGLEPVGYEAAVKKIPFNETWVFPFIIVLATLLPWILIGFSALAFSLKFYLKTHKCPQCKKIGLKVLRKWINYPSPDYPGKVEVRKSCRFCSFKETTIESVPKRSHSASSGSTSSSSGFSSFSSFSSGSSSSSSSSFGGGSSGGGGASGSW